jgi:transposase
LSQLSEDELKAFFVAGPNGTAIAPSDYPQLLSIARKLAALPPQARKDYLSRVNASTASLADLESSIDRYIQFRAEREKQFQGHEAAAKPLLGAEDLYTAYRGYKDLQRNVSMAGALKGAAKDKAEAEESYEYLKDQLKSAEATLLSLLKQKGFESIAAFEAALETYRAAFRTQAVNLALDVLARYENMLFEERKKLQQGGAATIAQGIAASKASEQYKEYHSQKEIAQNIWNSKEPKETWWQQPYRQAQNAAATAKGKAETEVVRGSGDRLVAERGVDLEKLAGLDAGGVQTYLTDLINERSASVQATRQEFKDDPDRVFKLPDLVAATQKLLGVDPSTIYGRTINDYISDEASKHLLSSLAIGVLAIALTFLVPGGGWLAAAALVAQAGISTYQAYTAYKEYQEQERDYELGFLSEEPSLFWVGLAIAAAALDLGVAATAVVKQSATALKALKGPLLEFSKDSDLAKLLAKIEAAQGLESKVKAALVREAEASLAAKAAWKELVGMGSRMGAFAGAVDPGVAKQLFRALYYSVKRGINTIARLSADAKFLEITGDITRMTGAERAQLETAFDEVKQLVQAGQAKGMDDKSLLGFVDRWSLNRAKPGFETKLAEEMKVWKPLTGDQKRALDALEAQKQAVATLYDQKAAAEEELAALRAQADRTPEDVAEIRALEKEVRSLDPQALPGAKPGFGKGKIAEAEATLATREAEAAKANLTLYDRLRAAAPSEAAKERALKGAVVDQVGPLKTKPGSLQADHIVSVREISDMDGFADLPWKDQKAIVDMKENLIAMDGAANASKGDRTWRSWGQAGTFYERSTIETMAKRESDVRALIQGEIKSRLDKLAGAKP